MNISEKRVSILYGENEYLKNKTIEDIKKQILGSSISELNFETYYSDEIEIQSLFEKAYVEPFMSENRIIILKFLNMEYFEDLCKKNMELLVEYIKSPSKSTFVILLVYGGIIKKPCKSIDELLKLVKETDYLDIIEFKPPKEFEIYSFITDKCKKAEKNIAKDAMDLLVGKSGNDLFNLENELTKIFIYVNGRKNIGLQDIENIVIDSKTREIFELVNSVGAKKEQESILILNRIAKNIEDIPVIISSIAKHIKRIWIAKALANKGKREYEISRVLGTKEYFVHNLLKDINKYSFENLSKSLEKLLKADIEIKTSGFPPKFILENLIIDLCSA